MAGRQKRIVSEALARGADHHRAGRWREAGAAYADALRVDADNVDANVLLGAVLLRLERPVEALALLDRAVRRDPRHALGHLNRGRVLLALARPVDALGAFEAALDARPEFPEAERGRAQALVAAGRAADAVPAVEAVLARGPATADLWALHAAALLAADRPADAERSVRHALAARPADARLHVDLGACLLARGEPEAAAATWDAAIGLAPALATDTDLIGRRAALARSIGLARLGAGDPEAVAWLRRALALAPTDRAGLAGLTDALFQHPDQAEAPDLALLLATDGVDHQRLARAMERLVDLPAGSEAASGATGAARAPRAERTLTNDPDTAVADTPVANTAVADTAVADTAVANTSVAETPVADTSGTTGAPITDDPLPPLLAAWLRRAVVTTAAWLPPLRALRRSLARRALAGEPVLLDVPEALAIQAWNTEHADLTAEDDALADALASALAEPLAEGLAADSLTEGAARGTAARPARLAAFASLRPLPAWPGAAALAAPGWEHRPLAALVRQQLVAPTQERAAADALPTLAATADTTSGIVAAMYEENPYPRLISVHRSAPVSFGDRVRAVLPGTDVPSRVPTRVLVAGGGTGQHPIGVAAGLTDAEVVAIDLSRASLGRAARLAREHGVPNVRFVQGDILALGPEDGLGVFDFVDCVGVLHHLADPRAGGRALVRKLAPGGLLRLGLYSERGRADVVAARALAAEHGWLPTPDGLRAARAALLALPPDHPAAGLGASVDLYSQSGLRDLVFHPCEHRFTPLQVAELVAALGLVALGLQHARPEPARLYRARWPDDAAMADLARWDTLEAEHPRLFAGMIHVWCRAG